MSFHHQPKIVTDGLILHLDSANPKSYPGSGNTWYNITGNIKNGTLDAPTFLNNVMNFDGFNDVVSFGDASTAIFPLPKFSIEMWFKSLGLADVYGTNPCLFGLTYGVYLNVDNGGITFTTSDASGNAASAYSSKIVCGDLTWHNIVASNDGSTSFVHLDSQLIATGPANWTGTTVWAYDSFNIGTNNNDYFYHFYGAIGHVKIYNRVLSLSEIQQNYNAIKSRYGR